MAKIAITDDEELGFIPDVDTSEEFDFQVDAALDLDEDVELGFVQDEPEEADPDLVDFTIDESFKVAVDEQFDQVAFTSDVFSMPQLESFEIADPSDVPGGTGEFEQAEFIKDANRIDFVEALKTKAGRPQELLPFVGPMFTISRMGRVMQSAQRIQQSPEPPKRGGMRSVTTVEDGEFVMGLEFGDSLVDESPEAFTRRQVEWMRDRYIVAEWVTELAERQERGITVGGRIAEGILELPAFMIEFLTTAGIYSGAKQGTKVAIAKVLQRAGAKVSKEFAEKVAKNTGIKLTTKALSVAIGTAARTSAQFTRVLESTVQRLMPDIQVTEKGGVLLRESQETPFSAFVKGFGDVYIENITEISGPAIGKVGKGILKRIPFLGKYSAELQKLWLRTNPDKGVADFVKTMGTKVGYNGFLEELGEEQLGKVLRAATGVETFGAVQTGDKVEDLVARMIAAIPDGEELLVEAGILAPLALIGGAGRVADVTGRKAVEPEAKEVIKPTPKAEGEVEKVRLFHAERTTGDIKEGEVLGTFFTSDKTVAEGFSGGKGEIGEFDVTIKKPLTIESVDKEFPEAFSPEEFIEVFKENGIEVREDVDGDTFSEILDDAGTPLIKEIKKKGFDALVFPDIIGNKTFDTTLVFDKKGIEDAKTVSKRQANIVTETQTQTQTQTQTPETGTQRQVRVKGDAGPTVAQEAKPERIQDVATRITGTGEVFTSVTTHAESTQQALDKLGVERTAETGEIGDVIEEGFITDTGRFVGRKEALGIAEQAKQKPLPRLADEKELDTSLLRRDALAQEAKPPTLTEVKALKPKAQTEAFTEQAKTPIDRTADDAQVETQNRVALVRNMSPAAQQEIADQSIDKVKERISFKKPKVTIRQGLKDLLFKTDKAFRDGFAGLRRAVNAADAGKLDPADDPVQLAVAFTQKSSAKTRGFVLEATTDLAGNRKSKGLKQIFTPIIKDGGKKNFDDFVVYLVAARDLNLQKQNKETGIDPVASQLTFDALDSPAFAQAAREVTEWNQKGIDLLVESGRITAESGEAIKTANPIYAPFFREFAEEEAPSGKGKGKKFVPKRLKGSKRKIIDPIEGMIQQMDATIQSAQRAAIERSMANLALDNPEALEDFIKPTRAPVVPTKFTVQEIKAELEEIGIDFTGVAPEDLNELLTIFRPSAITPPGVITLTVDGKKKFFKAEKELLEVLDGTEVYKLGPFWDFTVGKPTRLLKLGATGLNASFGLIRNPIRDIQTFTVTSEFAKGGPFSAVSGILKDVKTKASGIAENFGFKSLKPSSDVVKFAALGGEMSGFITQDRAGTRHIQHEMLASNGIRYTINTFRHPLDVLRSLVGITEIGTRIGEFTPALKEGEKLYGKGSLSASVFALNAAQDVTTNFSRHGQIGKQINQMVPFFNAAIQGPDKLVRSFRARPLKSTIAAVSTLTIPAIFFWWRNKDKEWYKNMTAHEKASYIHFEHPDHEDVIMRYPVPFELGHVFQAIPIAFLDAIHNERPEEVKEILQATLKSANPLDWPALIGPIIDIKANEDYASRPIVSRANEGKLAKDQFGPHTTELMKIIGKQINMSPSQIEHLTNSYTGGIYNRVARMIKNNDTEKQPADMPVIGTLFLRDPFAPRKQIEAFYNERTLLNKKFNSKDITLKDALRRIVMNNLATVLTVSFDSLRETKSIDQRKRVWGDIKRIVELTDEVAPK